MVCPSLLHLLIRSSLSQNATPIWLEHWCLAITNKLISGMPFHLKHASENGHQKAMIRTRYWCCNFGHFHFQWPSTIRTVDIYRYKKSHQNKPIHQLSVLLGPDTSRVLPLFHAFTGCDSPIQFFRTRKKTAWKIWKGFPDLTETLLSINNDPNSFSI